MGFRYVEPEPREPQPAVPLRWVVLGTVALVVLPFLPVFFGLVLGVLTVLEDRYDDAPVRAPVHEFHRSELEPKKRVYPEYPDAAKPLNHPPQRCLAVVSIDDEGTPYDVAVDNCPEVFVPATREALLKWRWYPPKKEGKPTSARTTIAVTYQMKDDPMPPTHERVEAEIAEREAQREDVRARVEQRRAEREAGEWVGERDRAAACEELRAQFIASGVEMSDSLHPCSAPSDEPVRLNMDMSQD